MMLFACGERNAFDSHSALWVHRSQPSFSTWVKMLTKQRSAFGCERIIKNEGYGYRSEAHTTRSILFEFCAP